MGSWNGTCGISHLPIMHGEPCRLVFIRKGDGGWRTEGGSGFTRTTALWHPVCFPILGNYDDGGAIEEFDVNDWRIKEFFAWLGPRIVEQEEGENSVHDWPIRKPEILDMVKLQDAIHSQGKRVKVSDSIGRSMHRSEVAYAGNLLGYVLIREDVYQGLVSMQVESWSDEAITKATTLVKLNSWVDVKCDAAAEIERRTAADMLSLFTILHGQQREYELWSGYEPHLAEFGHSLVTRLTVLGADVEVIRAEFKSKLEAVAELLMLGWHMESLRRHWSQQCGAGSQDGFESHKTFAKLVDKVIRAAEADRNR